MSEDATLVVVGNKVDDLAALGKLIARGLPDSQVITAIGAAEGLKLAQMPDISLVLVELDGGPSEDCIDLCRRLKGQELTAHIPILLLAGSDATSHLQHRCLDAGADDCVSKRLDNAELIARIRALLRAPKTEAQRRRTDHAPDRPLGEQQDIEAIGQLVRNVSHEFNNLLTAVIGNAQLIQMHTEDASQHAELAAQIEAAARQAAGLSRRLMTLARERSLHEPSSSSNLPRDVREHPLRR